MQTVTLVVENKERFDSKLAELQRKAKKLGFAVPVVTECKTERVTKIVNYRQYSALEYTVTLSYTEIKVGNFSLVAKINGIEKQIHVAPNATLPDEQKNYSMHCDACHVNNNRQDIFVICEGKTHLRVGRNCLARYLGIKPEQILASVAGFEEINNFLTDDYCNHHNVTSVDCIDLHFLLCVTNRVINIVGYCSGKTAKEKGITPTSTLVNLILADDERYIPKNLKPLLNAINTGESLSSQDVIDCIAWMKTLGSSRNEYELNLFHIAENGFVTGLTFNTAVSAMGSYLRNKAQAQEKITSFSKFVGNIGESFTSKKPLEVICIRLSEPKEEYNEYTRSYESKQWYTFAQNNDIFTTYTTTGKCKELDKVQLTGKIVKHTEYNGEKRTQLSNCRFKIV